MKPIAESMIDNLFWPAHGAIFSDVFFSLRRQAATPVVNLTMYATDVSISIDQELDVCLEFLTGGVAQQVRSREWSPDMNYPDISADYPTVWRQV